MGLFRSYCGSWHPTYLRSNNWPRVDAAADVRIFWSKWSILRKFLVFFVNNTVWIIVLQGLKYCLRRIMTYLIAGTDWHSPEMERHAFILFV